MTIKEAAVHFGISEPTVRRRIKDGVLQGFKQPTTQGYEWRVLVPDTVDQPNQTEQHNDHLIDTAKLFDDQVINGSEVFDDQVVNQSEYNDDQVINTPNSSLVQVVLQLHQENVQLAGQLGFYQARIQALEEQVRLLTDSQHTPEHPAPDAEPTPQAADQPAKRVPWWRKWFADI